jgi:ElaA protein
MEVHVKRFDQLSIHELYDILKLRNSIFVVEQNCPFGDVDGYDKEAYHVFLTDKDGIQAYLRVLDRNSMYDGVSFGRVLAVKRHCGLATRVLEEGIRVAKEKFGAERIVLHAESYARSLYEKIGFRQTAEEFLEDNIPFIPMEMKLALEIAC